jgi:glycerophosphoryl diester phosphodiesterase
MLVTAVLFSGCSGHTTKPAPNPQPDFSRHPAFDLQGHRGARGLLPENTIPSFLEALRHGVTTLELDLVMSADSQLVVSHEPWFHFDISSHPDGRPVTFEERGDFNMFAMTYEEILQFDVGMRGNPRFPEQQPMPAVKPLLSEVIESVEEYIRQNNLPKVWYNIETKSSAESYGWFVPFPEVFAAALYNELARLQVLDRVVIQSFDVNTLKFMAEIDRRIPQSLLVSNEHGVEWNIFQLGYVPDIYSPNYELVDDYLVSEVRRFGMKLIPWTINDPDNMIRLLEFGVDGLITDYPNRAIALPEIRSRLGLEP